MDNFNLNRTPILKFVIPLILGILSYKMSPDIYEIHFEFIVFILLYVLFSALILKEHLTLIGLHWMLFFFLFGGIHTRLSQLNYEACHFSHSSESEFLILRVDEIVSLTNSTRCLTTVLFIGNDSLNIERSNGKLMAYFSNDIDNNLDIGQCLMVKNKFFLENSNTNPHVFDYKEYLNNRGIYHRSHFKKDDIILLSNLDYDNLSIKAKRLRNKCIDHLDTLLTKKNNLAVAAAMILGERKLLSEELYEAYTDTGAVHVLAVSGLHVGILASFIVLLFKIFPSNSVATKVVQTATIIIAIWAFAFLTGLAAAVTRAALMFSLYFLGKGISRKSNSLNTLAAAALIMLVYDPYYLFQAGFQFSFLALLGILTFYGPIYRTLIFKWWPFKWLWSGIAVSISAQLLVSPLAIGYFHKLPTYFWLSGIFAVPAAFAILALGLTALALIFIIGSDSFILKIIGTILDTTITWFNNIIFWIQELPLCSADNLWISPTSILLIYTAIGFLTYFIKKKEYTFLYGFFICLIIQVINHNLENKQEWKKSTLFVYDNYKGTVIDYITTGKLYQYTSDSLDQRSIDYVTKNNRLYNRIISEGDTHSIGISSHNSLYQIRNRLLLLDPKEADLEWSTAEPIDILVLTANSSGNIYQLNKQYCPQQIILDGTVKDKERTYHNRAAKNLDIPLHHTSKDGAYTLSL